MQTKDRMKKRLSYFLFLFCFSSSIIFAQETHIWYYDDFQLNNNSVFVGKDTLVTLYYSDGSKKAFGKFALDKDGKLSPFKVGEWIFYNPNGSVQSQGSYQMSSFIDCGTGGPEQIFYHYKTGKWSFFDTDENVVAEGTFKNDEFPISTRCGSETILFGITDSSWDYSDFEGLDIRDIETVEIDYEDFSAKMFYDRKEEWIQVEYDLSP